MFIGLRVSITNKANDATVEKVYQPATVVWNNWNDFHQTFQRKLRIVYEGR